MGRSMLAITIGYVFSVILVMTTFLLVGQVTQTLTNEAANSDLVEIVSMVVQFFSLLYAIGGGYVTARLVKDKKIQHAMATGAVIVAIALLSIFASGAGALPWWHTTFLILVIPAAALGGKLNARSVRS